MTKDEMLDLLKLLSALEAAGVMNQPRLPAYLLEDLERAVDVLRREILK